MTVIFPLDNGDFSAPARPRFRAMARGFACRCPNCGRDRLFRRFLKPVATCATCGEDFTHQRADDAPPYFTILLVGHIVVPLLTLVLLMTDLPMIVHLALWLPLTAGLTFALMQPVKGTIIALQWALRMHGFDGLGEPEDRDDGQFLPNAGLAAE